MLRELILDGDVYTSVLTKIRKTSWDSKPEKLQSGVALLISDSILKLFYQTTKVIIFREVFTVTQMGG